MEEWIESGQHLYTVRNGEVVWMAHCCACGLGVEETKYEPPVDYLCESCE